MITYEESQPWITYTYGTTHDGWWPLWRSTHILGCACIVAQCLRCGQWEPIWFRVKRFGDIPDRGHHPKRVAFMLEHACCV